jgi:hypothetical protein
MFKTLLILIFATTISLANVLKIGDTLTPFNLPDQFDKVHTISSDKYEIFLISFAKDTSSKVNEYLKKQNVGFLEQNKIVYISDIHTMPSFVTSLFALPKMRKYKYTLMLMYEENKVFPQQGDDLTVIEFKNNKVNSIEFIKKDESIDSIFN